MAYEEPSNAFEEDLFRTIQVRELQDEDFILGSVERIVLKANGCSIVLVYSLKDKTSKGLRSIWDELADTLAGINFFALNASRRINIMRAWQEVSDDLDHPLNAYRIRGYPSIIVFREGGQPGLSWPKAFYNGDLSLASLQDWILTLACTPGYTEVPLMREGIVTDSDIVVTDERSRGGERAATSLDFQSGDFRIDQKTIEDYQDLDEDFREEVYEEGLNEAEVLQKSEDLREERANIRRLREGDRGGYGSVSDPGFMSYYDDDNLDL